MPSSFDKIRLNLLAMLESIDKIQEYCKEADSADDFYHDTKSFDATMMQFIVIGESIDRLDDAYKKANDTVPWQQIKDFRNIVAHHYFGIDAEEVWDIIQNHLDPLRKNLEKLLEAINP